jgi:hypothetical protein
MQITQGTVEIRVKGKWAKVPSIEFNGMTLFAKGKLPRIAVIRGEDMMECELKKPEQYVNLLTSGNTGSVHADIFTFTQRLPGSQPQFSYPMEWESVAAIQTQSFGNWWENLPQETRKNVRRSQKRGVSIRISEFNDKLIQDIREVNDDSPHGRDCRTPILAKASMRLENYMASLKDDVTSSAHMSNPSW